MIDIYKLSQRSDYFNMVSDLAIVLPELLDNSGLIPMPVEYPCVGVYNISDVINVIRGKCGSVEIVYIYLSDFEKEL